MVQREVSHGGASSFPSSLAAVGSWALGRLCKDGGVVRLMCLGCTGRDGFGRFFQGGRWVHLCVPRKELAKT